MGTSHTDGEVTLTSDRAYEADNGFSSEVVTMGATSTALYTTGNTRVTRVAGRKVIVYTLHIENQTGSQGWLNLENAQNDALTISFPVANNDALTDNWPSGLHLGDTDIYLGGTASMVAQISGIAV